MHGRFRLGFHVGHLRGTAARHHGVSARMGASKARSGGECDLLTTSSHCLVLKRATHSNPECVHTDIATSARSRAEQTQVKNTTRLCALLYIQRVCTQADWRICKKHFIFSEPWLRSMVPHTLIHLLRSPPQLLIIIQSILAGVRYMGKLATQALREEGIGETDANNTGKNTKKNQWTLIRNW